MSITTPKIACMALGHIGISVGIESLNENSPEARACLLYYDQCLERVLEQVDWYFARRRKSLAVTTNERDGWTYVYELPSDCLKARYIVNPSARTPAEKDRIPFEVYEDESAGQMLIATDQDDAVLQYTCPITNPAMFSGTFVECLTWDLAYHVAGPMRVDDTVKEKAEKRAFFWINEAGSQSLSTGTEDPMPDSEFVTGRA